MLKTIFSIALTTLLLTSASAFASGRLTMTGNQYGDEVALYPVIGIAVDEKLMAPAYFTSWIGVGQRPVLGETKEWGAVKLGVDFRFAGFTLGGGVFANTGSANPTDSLSALSLDGAETGGYLKGSLKLWD